MELKVSRLKNKDKNDRHVVPVDNKNIISHVNTNTREVRISDALLERYSISSGIDLCRHENNYYISIDNELLSITEQEAVVIYEHPEKVYDIVLDKTRKFHFSSSEDNINITIGNM